MYVHYLEARTVLRHIPMCGLRAVTSIKDSFMSLLILSMFASMPTTQLSVKETEASPSSLAEFNTFLIWEEERGGVTL